MTEYRAHRIVARFSFSLLPRALCLLALAWLVACADQPAGKRVSLSNINRDERHIPDRPAKGALRIAVAAMVTPRETLDVYQDILDYIGQRLDRPVELVQRKTYAEVNDLLRRNLIDAAFICTQAYVEGRRDFGLELLVAPVIKDRAEYYSYIIVPIDSPIESLEQLRGRSFAFVDPMSNTGRLVPTYLLAKMGETPDSFFGRYVFTYAHSNSIRTVAQGLVEGAAVDSLVWDYANTVDPVYTARTRIIYRSPPFGSPPVVVPPDLASGLKRQLQGVLLGMNQDQKGSRLLSKAGIDRFTLIEDRAYDPIRVMMAEVDQTRADR